MAVISSVRPTADFQEPLSLCDLKKKIMVPREDFELWLQLWDWTYHQLARNEFPDGFESIDEFQLACICDDPVLWAAAFLREPDDPEKPYTFWDYQEESVRYRGNTLHECGAEVGKTREILTYALYNAFTAYRGSGLIAAPMSIHLHEIIDAIEEQLAFNPDLANSLVKHRKHPHHHMKFTSGFTLDFRPTGYDGTALRGVHVRTFAMMDEAAKAKNPDIFKEFWRAGKPECTYKLYSTPDGDRSCQFYKLCQKAEGSLDEKEAEKMDKVAASLKFHKFHWSKLLMPAPFWTKARKKFYIDQYGGEDSPGYQQNVKGNWGDPENTVFPWHQFKFLLKSIPEYKVLKILVDKSTEEVSIFCAEYEKNGAGDERGNYTEKIIDERTIGENDFDIKAEIKSYFSYVPGLKIGGADLGFSQDPTEIVIKLIFGNIHRVIARVQLKGVTYDLQCKAIDALDDVYDSGKLSMGWGVDFGNAGTAVVHQLQNEEQYEDKDYEDRLTGYLFGAAYIAVDEDGEYILDKNTDKPVKLLGKELSTDLLVSKMQRQQLEYPLDPDFALLYPNHTYRQGPKHRIFKKEDDHLIDADRAATMRAILPGEGEEDIFV